MKFAAQVRAARGLLNWSQSRLCEEAEVSRGALADLETEKRTPHESTAGKIRDALTRVGVEFLDEDHAPGVRLNLVSGEKSA